MTCSRLAVWAVSLGMTLALATGAAAEDKLSVADMVKASEKAMTEVQGTRAHAEAALRQARADQDMKQLDCVTEALIAMKGVMKLFEGYYYDLATESKAGNQKGAEDAYGKLTTAKKKLDELDNRVRGCGGPSRTGVVEGKPLVERSVEPGGPNQDPVLAQWLEWLESWWPVQNKAPSPYM